MRRFVRFCYLSNETHGRRLRPHQLRDESAVVELYERLCRCGLTYGGVFLNWSYPHGTADTSTADLERLGMGEQDLLLLTTRPPIHDEPGDKHPLVKSGSDVEAEMLRSLERQCFATCKRTCIALREHLKGAMQPGFEKRFRSRFYSTGAEAPHVERERGSKKAVRGSTSAGYLVHVPLGNGRPGVLAVFGMSGTMTLIWAYRLSRMPELEWALEAPSLLMAEISLTEGIPERPATLGFSDQWSIEIAAKCRL
jgi:hypothetical protein